MMNLEPPEIDPTYLTDNYPDYYCCRVIKTTARLESLVADALVSGTLDISNCVINVWVDFARLLKQCGLQPTTRLLKQCKKQPTMGIENTTQSLECPFEINANCTLFEKSIWFGTPILNERKWNEPFIVFKEKLNFQCARFNEFTMFGDNIFNSKLDLSFTTFNAMVSFLSATFNEEVLLHSTQFKNIAGFGNLTIKSNDTLSFSGLTVENKFHLSLAKDCFKKIQIEYFFFKENGCIIVDYKKENHEQQWTLEIPNMECDGDAVRVKIRNLSEESKAEIKFKDCHFYGKNVAFTNVAMKNVSIEGGNTVKGMLFDHCHFDPTQLTQGLLKNLKFKALAGEEDWIDSKDTQKIKERALVYASLKTTATEGGETQLANDFHFWQQYYQGKLQFSLWNTLYKYTSAYGLDVKLPIIWFGTLIITFACFYTLFLKPTLLPIETFLILGYIGICSLLPTIVEYTTLKKLNIFSFVYYGIIAIFSIVLFFSVLELNETLVKGLPLSVSGSLPFMFADNETIKNLLEKVKITGADLKPLAFYAGYIVQHLAQGFLLFQIGAAIRNKVKR